MSEGDIYQVNFGHLCPNQDLAALFDRDRKAEEGMLVFSLAEQSVGQGCQVP